MTAFSTQKKKRPGFDPSEVSEGLRRAISLGRDSLESHQHKDGYFWYTLEANDTINAETILLMRYLGLQDQNTERALGNWLLQNQNPDGSWSLYYGGTGDLSATGECYLALKRIRETNTFPPNDEGQRFHPQKRGDHEGEGFYKDPSRPFWVCGLGDLPKNACRTHPAPPLVSNQHL